MSSVGRNVHGSELSVGRKVYKLFQLIQRLECGPMPNVMAALPSIGGALCSTPQSVADAHYYAVQ